MKRATELVLGLTLVSAVAATTAGCGRKSGAAGAGTRADPSVASAGATGSSRTTAEPGSPRPGMAWVPAGTFRAGTPSDRTPRVADEELPGTAIEMGGFYIDLLPWPNEPNAIPTTNVTRDEAEQLCAAKGKRLCSELEWERACKGPESSTYEYGNAYRKDTCGTGVTIEEAARRPTGEHAQCKSGFGVAEMHGSVFEWTSSVWGRGSQNGSQGVLRGGNSPAGELVGRCSNALARSPSKKAPTMGLRCCAGSRNAAEVKLEVSGTPNFVLTNSKVAAAWSSALAAVGSSPAIDPSSLHAWSWIPVGNEELVVATGCTSAPRTCGLVVGRPGDPEGTHNSQVLASLATGKDAAEIARNGDVRHLRVRSLDAHGIVSREVTYAYGRIEVGEPKRP